MTTADVRFTVPNRTHPLSSVVPPIVSEAAGKKLGRGANVVCKTNGEGGDGERGVGGC